MMDLVEFLRARIAEDERRAQAAISAGLGVDLGPDGDLLSANDDVQDHLATWYPARVLAECEAKRRIVDLHSVSVAREWVNPVDGPAHQEDEHTCAVCGWVPDACETIKLLALPYAGRPDWREEWRP